MKPILTKILYFLLISTTPVKANYADAAIGGFIAGVIHGWNVLFSDDKCSGKECKETIKNDIESDKVRESTINSK